MEKKPTKNQLVKSKEILDLLQTKYVLSLSKFKFLLVSIGRLKTLMSFSLVSVLQRALCSIRGLRTQHK